MIKLITALFLPWLLFSLPGGEASLVYLKNGKLAYQPYANEGQTEAVNQIPDFSFAGYNGGGVALPQVAVKATISPAKGDCRALIQAAIDQVSALPADKNGMRGAVLLKAGVYPVEGSLTINVSGVVLRGEGNGTTGTVLIATQKQQHDLIKLVGKAGKLTLPKTGVRITSAYVPSGTRTVEIAEGLAVKPGDRIVIQRTPNDAWIEALAMRQYGWKADDYRIGYERTVQAVAGRQLTVDMPLVDAIDNKWGGGEVAKISVPERLAQCGVENLRIESQFADDQDEKHGWNAVTLRGAENCWVKGVVAKYFGMGCVFIQEGSVFNTVEDCAMIDPKSITTGGRKYSFNLAGASVGNLFQRCAAWGGRHDYVTGSRVPGPNVFLDCVAENTFSDIGPHHRWTTGVLFDNIRGGQIRVQNRKAMGSGHGWAGAQTLFWNCESVKSEFKVESPLGAKNWAIGCVGKIQQGGGFWESWGKSVTPRSLYLQQLQDRLGQQAVLNITTEEQRSGQLWNRLAQQANHITSEQQTVLTAMK
ncbi:glycoside hydrolase family 55 protein [Tellurirhabdus bombi]|uniref:glycoside hydrolase family 55 protein n=1 Tax=Tellurirhabdus bombi TaxID=2907205 RepID=UPI001F2EE9DC|nr:glycoside hydrolase family 55 protein [Tellurirhabdus bombi]